MCPIYCHQPEMSEGSEVKGVMQRSLLTLNMGLTERKYICYLPNPKSNTLATKQVIDD